MPFAFIFPNKIHLAVGHRRVENILKCFWSFGNLSGDFKADIDEAVRAVIDEIFQFLRESHLMQ